MTLEERLRMFVVALEGDAAQLHEEDNEDQAEYVEFIVHRLKEILEH